MGPLTQYAPQAIALAKSMITSPMSKIAYNRSAAILADQVTKMNQAGHPWNIIKQIIEQNRQGLKF